MAKTTNNNSNVLGIIFLITVFVAAFLIGNIEENNSYFLLLLLLVIGFGAYYSNRFGSTIVTICRVIIGLLFIFSGTVKGIDPVGTAYRIEDYFIAYGTDWANSLAMPLSVLLNATEFIIGVMLLFNIKMKLTSWLVMLMMAVFTFVTINDALYNPVPDCGCFGDAIILSNWQTLYKNLVLDALVLVVFFTRNSSKRTFKPVVEWAIFLVFGLAFIFFEIYNIRHLPVVDFRNWKVGNKMVVENPLPLKYYLKYRNKETGEEKEYISPDYPYHDSVWLSKWEFVSQRIENPNPKLHDLYIENLDGIDVTEQVIQNTDLQFILVSYDLKEGNWEKIDDVRQFIKSCDEDDHSFVVLTASFREDIDEFEQGHALNTDYCHADDIVLMSMIRSNPGLILMRDGVVLGKWHYNDFPFYDQVIREFATPVE
ncbi:MAG: DoxX family protein [Bacteroidales bacterium]|nr:DoxX family protein [Bacteroidales bacterium]